MSSITVGTLIESLVVNGNSSCWERIRKDRDSIDMYYSLLIGNESFFSLPLLDAFGQLARRGRVPTIIADRLQPCALLRSMGENRVAVTRLKHFSFFVLYSSLLIIRHQISEIDLRSPPVVRLLSRSFSAWLRSPINDAHAATGQLDLLHFLLDQWNSREIRADSFFAC